MATTVKLNPSGGATYGHNKTTSTTSTGTGTLYMGSCYGGSNYLHYGSSIPFKLANPTADGSPVVITSAILTASKKNNTPFNDSSTKNNNCVYVNQTAAPSPNYSGVTDRSNAPAFTASTDLSKYLDVLSTYVSNSSTFYVHIMDASLSLTGKVNSAGQQGGTIYGSSEKAKPYLTLTWEYANSTGYLSTSTITAGTAFNLSLNVKGNNYYHAVSYKVGDSNAINITDLPTSWGTKDKAATVGTSSKSITISPTAAQIYSWFGTTGTSKTITFTITTYKVGSETKVGNSVDISATLSLSQNYCRNRDDYKPTIQISYARKGDNTKDISNYTKYNINDTISIISGSNFSIKSHKLTVSGNYSSSLTVSNTSATSLSFTPVLGTGAMTATSTVTDERGYTYYSTITINPSRTSYSLPVISESSVVFRTNGESKKTDGTYLGVSIQANYSSVTSKRSLSLALDGSSNTLISNLNGTSNPITLSSNKAGTNTYDTEKSYTFVITAYDDVLSNSDYNHPYGASVTKKITLSKAEFIIHISDAGAGLGFMTSGEKGYICLGKPVKGLKIPTTDNGYISLEGSQQNICESLGTLYIGNSSAVSIPTLTSTTLTAGTLKTDAITNTDASPLSLVKYTSGLTTIGNTVSNLALTGKSVYFNIGGKTYYPTYDSDIFYKDGEIVSFHKDTTTPSAIFYGYMTKSSTRIDLMIVLPKRLDKVSGIKITNMTGIMRTASGYGLADDYVSGGQDYLSYIINKGESFDSYPTSTDFVDDGSGASNSFMLTLYKKTFDGTNNRSLTFVPLNFSFTFTSTDAQITR